MLIDVIKKIQKEHILLAIKEIDQDGVRPGRQSTTYDLVDNDKKYPPKLVLSIAARYGTGEELEADKFVGGLDTSAFKLLRD